jgi:hypothetical protein
LLFVVMTVFHSPNTLLAILNLIFFCIYFFYLQHLTKLQHSDSTSLLRYFFTIPLLRPTTYLPSPLYPHDLTPPLPSPLFSLPCTPSFSILYSAQHTPSFTTLLTSPHPLPSLSLSCTTLHLNSPHLILPLPSLSLSGNLFYSVLL